MADSKRFNGDVAFNGAVKLRGYDTKVPSILVKHAAPTALGDGAAVGITIAQLLTGVMTADPQGDRAFTLPTAADAVAGVTGVEVGDCIDFTIISLATANADETITLGAGSGGSVVGNAAILSPNAGDNEYSSGSALFRLRFTNVTAGSEAYTCHRLA